MNAAYRDLPHYFPDRASAERWERDYCGTNARVVSLWEQGRCLGFAVRSGDRYATNGDVAQIGDIDAPSPADVASDPRA